VKRRDEEEGSAVVEFVLIATPLFLPALLFFMAMQNSAMEEMRVENLARQTVRAFTTADSILEGHQRIKYVLDRYSELESKGSKRYGFTYNIDCGGVRCLTPGSRVKIELYRTFDVQSMENEATVAKAWDGPPSSDKSSGNRGEMLSSRKAVAVAIGIVDKWRE
jgi:hypothetical protein